MKSIFGSNNVMPNVQKIMETGYWKRADKISYEPESPDFPKLLITIYDIKQWQEFDQLTMGKYIEFEWVKGHSFHFENTLCDYYAKQCAMRN